MGHRIDPSWGGPIELFLILASAPMCYSVCGVMHIKEPLLLIGKNTFHVQLLNVGHGYGFVR